MKKLLFLTSFLPYPLLNGGKIRQYYLLKELSKKYNITLMSLIYNDKEYEYKQELEKICKKVILIKYIPFPVNKIKLFFSLKPQLFYPYQSKEFKYEFESTISREKFDIIHCEYSFTAMNIKKLDNTFSSITVQESQSVMCRRKMIVAQKWYYKLHWLIQYYKSRFFEKRMIKKFNISFTCSENDRKYLAGFIKDTKFKVIENCLNLEDYKFDNKIIKNKNIIFIGALDTVPNKDGVIYFCEKIFPLILEESPAAKLIIAGSPIPEEIKKYNNGKNIIFTGYVKDIKEYIYNSRVVVVPLRIGSGTRFKILESAACGRPIVSTTIGAEGIEFEHNEHILIVGNNFSFAKNVLDLLYDDNLYNKLIINARRKIEEKYNVEVIAKKIIEEYEKMK